MIRVPRTAVKVAAASMLLGCLLQLMSIEPVATTASFISLAAILLILWTKDEPPLLLFPALMQWTQVALVPISTLWLGRTMKEEANYSGAGVEVALFGLAGVTLLALGLRLGASRVSRDKKFLMELRREGVNWSVHHVLILAYTAIIVGYLAAAASVYGSSARELFNQISNVKHAGLFILTFWCLLNKKKTALLLATIGLDIVIGMTGFFAEFKVTVIAVVIAAFAARASVRQRDLLVIATSVVLLAGTAIFWSAIKNDYRNFMNLGTGAQIVAVERGTQLNYLSESIAKFDGVEIQNGFNLFVARWGYLDFLGLTLENVPKRIAHEDGALTVAAMRHILMPRLLFPGKPPLPSDTDVMAKYTGLPNLWTSNTSISIGYLGELYIDFGIFGALLAAFLLGVLIGRLYAIIRDYRKAPRLLRLCLCFVVLIPVFSFETALAKVIGALAFGFVIALFAQRVALPILFPKMISVMRQPSLPSNLQS